MSPSLAARAARLALLLSLASCTAWSDRELAETRSGLMGLSGLELRECLGVPTDFEVEGDVEKQGYLFEIRDERDAGFETGRIEAGIGGPGFPGERSYEPRGFPLDDGPPPFCRLDFELTKGRVTHVDAQGRTREGMNADASCLMRAQECVLQTDAGERDE